MNLRLLEHYRSIVRLRRKAGICYLQFHRKAVIAMKLYLNDFKFIYSYHTREDRKEIDKRKLVE